MICNSCGNAVEAFNRFCPKCGAPVQAQSPQPLGGPPLYSSPQTPMMGGPMAQPAKKSSCGKIILIVVIILLVLGGGLAAAIYFGYQQLEKTLKSSEAYSVAVAALKENEEVKEQLGEIKDTGFPLGAFSTSADGSGNAAFAMSVQGTKASGQYEVNLVRSNSVWRLTKGVVRTNSGNTIQIADKRESNEDELNSNNTTGTDIDNPENLTTGKTVSGGVLNGKAISLPKPAYPPTAKEAKASGTVVVQVLVDEKGNVVSARAVSGHPLLQAASVVAARQAKFGPTKVAGQPVKVSGVITYDFTLD
jgi:TonB family protein